MKECMICGKQTEGSIGAAGIKWSSICQPCKDKEDKDLLETITHQNILFKRITGENMRHVENGWSSYRDCQARDLIQTLDGLQCTNCGALQIKNEWVPYNEVLKRKREQNDVLHSST